MAASKNMGFTYHRQQDTQSQNNSFESILAAYHRAYVQQKCTEMGYNDYASTKFRGGIRKSTWRRKKLDIKEDELKTAVMEVCEASRALIM